MADPYPTYQRLLEEAPLFYNERYDFYAVSRFDDCRDGLRDARSYISGRGGILEIIKADMEMPSWVIGIPESDLEAVRDWVDANLRTRPGEPMQPGTRASATG